MEVKNRIFGITILIIKTQHEKNRTLKLDKALFITYYFVITYSLCDFAQAN